MSNHWLLSVRRFGLGTVKTVFGEPSSQLWERHDFSDFETKTADKLNQAS